MLSLKNLSKSYDPHLPPILKNISLDIHTGEIFGIIGLSGAGKSTLLRTLNYLVPPSSGSVSINHIDLNTLSKSQLRAQRQKIGMVFQDFNLLDSRNILDNIKLPLEIQKKSDSKTQSNQYNQSNQHVLKLLDFVGLSGFEYKYPHQLSGGQKQRVAIARALINNPQILLCDEPTSALDPETTQTILTLLKKINSELNITIVFITHEMSVIKFICDRVAVLSQGKIIECKPVLELFTSPKTLEAKKLVQSHIHLDIPKPLQSKLVKKPSKIKPYPLIKLIFMGDSAKSSITATLPLKFKISANILQADLEYLNNKPIGFMLCELLGNMECLNDVLDYLKTQSIQYTILGYVDGQ